MSIELFEIVQSGNIGMQLGATPFVQGFDDVDWEQPLECFDIVEARGSIITPDIPTGRITILREGNWKFSVMLNCEFSTSRTMQYQLWVSLAGGAFANAGPTLSQVGLGAGKSNILPYTGHLNFPAAALPVVMELRGQCLSSTVDVTFNSGNYGLTYAGAPV